MLLLNTACSAGCASCAVSAGTGWLVSVRCIGRHCCCCMGAAPLAGRATSRSRRRTGCHLFGRSSSSWCTVCSHSACSGEAGAAAAAGPGAGAAGAAAVGAAAAEAAAAGSSRSRSRSSSSSRSSARSSSSRSSTRTKSSSRMGLKWEQQQTRCRSRRCSSSNRGGRGSGDHPAGPWLQNATLSHFAQQSQQQQQQWGQHQRGPAAAGPAAWWLTLHSSSCCLYRCSHQQAAHSHRQVVMQLGCVFCVGTWNWLLERQCPAMVAIRAVPPPLRPSTQWIVGSPLQRPCGGVCVCVCRVNQTGVAVQQFVTTSPKLFEPYKDEDIHGGPPLIHVPGHLSSLGHDYYLGVFHFFKVRTGRSSAPGLQGGSVLLLQILPCSPPQPSGDQLKQ